MKNTIYIIHIEPLETRYTSQLRRYLPSQLENGLSDYYNIVNIDGEQSEIEPTEGAFLNFIDTNIYKSTQGLKIFKYFSTNEIHDGDIFLFLDAWNPIIIQLRYILDLMNINAKIAGIFHSGSYDPQDFLGRLIKNKDWSYNFERSLYHAIDMNFFATEFHIDMFFNTLKPIADNWSKASLEYEKRTGKIIRTGLPLDYLMHELEPYRNLEKEDIILFPHRLAPEKQLDIFKDLEKELPEFKFIVAQEQKLTKHEYHTLLGKARMVFSANLQETLGISTYEGVICGAIPCVPDRLSYAEMYGDIYRYPSEWTIDFESYVQNKEQIKGEIRTMMKAAPTFMNRELTVDMHNLANNFFSSKFIIEQFRSENENHNIKQII